MGKKSTRRTGERSAQTKSPKAGAKPSKASVNPTSKSPIPKAAAGAVAAAPPTTGADTTRGRVVGYTVGREGLVVKLDVSALNKIAFSVAADEPHFRSAVSMTMVALNNRINPNARSDGIDQQYLWVWLKSGTNGQDIRPASVVAMSFDTGSDPFDIEGFIS